MPVVTHCTGFRALDTVELTVPVAGPIGIRVRVGLKAQRDDGEWMAAYRILELAWHHTDPLDAEAITRIAGPAAEWLAEPAELPHRIGHAIDDRCQAEADRALAEELGRMSAVELAAYDPDRDHRAAE